MEHLRAAKCGYILELSLSDGSAVVADDGKLGLSVSEHLHDGLSLLFRVLVFFVNFIL